MGVCKICGKYKSLSFEHVPPQSSFNDEKVKIIQGDEALRSLTRTEKNPWELDGLKWKQQQLGKGGYFLCESCNSATGSWYIPEYDRFVNIIYSAYLKAIRKRREQEEQDNIIGSIMITGIKDIHPLPIFKQIITMFCDVDLNCCMGDDALKEFLLNKTSKNFNKNKYHVYAHIHSGAVERMNGIGDISSFVDGQIKTIYKISEISVFPIGFTLYIDKPDWFEPEGVDITGFSDYDYETTCNIDKLIIPILECNSVISGNYSTKEEIIANS